jgi:hypothetical protein
MTLEISNATISHYPNGGHRLVSLEFSHPETTTRNITKILCEKCGKSLEEVREEVTETATVKTYGA